MTSMGRCKNCIHWIDTNCESGKMSERGYAKQGTEKQDTSDMVIYPYDEGGYFSTGPEFGCVHFSGIITDENQNGGNDCG